jgi:ribonuclease P protein component
MQIKKYSKQYVSVNKNKDFQFLFKKGDCIVTSGFICYVRETKRKQNRLGIVTGKKIGNAVKRNRARRVLREAFRLTEPMLREQSDKRFDFVFVARGKTPYLKSSKLQEMLIKQLQNKLMLK